MTPCKGIYADVKKTPFIDTGFSFDVLHENYSHYKRFKEEEIKFPSELKGFLMKLMKYLIYLCIPWSGLQYRTNFTVVRIYFDTPTFDKITKDEKVKFVDMLSAIGGTMGLLTGFSIISGVEILYYVVQFLFSLFFKNKAL